LSSSFCSFFKIATSWTLFVEEDGGGNFFAFPDDDAFVRLRVMREAAIDGSASRSLYLKYV
jgi:hypothetical protein